MVPYVNYNELDEFYTLKGVCDLLKMDTVKVMWRSVLNAAKVTAAILFMTGTAKAFAWVLTSRQIPQKLAAAIMSISSNRFTFFLLTVLFLLLIGCFIVETASVPILAPIFAPLAAQFGISAERWRFRGGDRPRRPAKHRRGTKRGRLCTGLQQVPDNDLFFDPAGAEKGTGLPHQHDLHYHQGYVHADVDHHLRADLSVQSGQHL